MTNELFIHVPYLQLERRMETVIRHRINPELFFPAEALDGFLPRTVAAQAEMLTAHGLATTIHAPFMDLNPGSLEPLLREATEHRFRQVLQVAKTLKPRVIVFHPGYDRWRYGNQQQAWLDQSVRMWRMVLEEAEEIGCVIAVENIFEEEPSTLRMLLQAVDSPLFRHCFDVGHWNLFHKVSLPEWFAELGSYIAEVHVHDNYGLRDDHAPIGEGNIDFDLYFSLMKSHAPTSVYTIEAHDPEAISRARERLEQRLSAGPPP